MNQSDPLYPLRISLVAGRHAVVGGLCAGLNIGIMHVSTAVLRWPYGVGILLTFFITVPIGYFLHRKHTFRSGHGATWPEFGRYCSQQLLQSIVGVTLVVANVEWLGLSPTWAMAGATAVLWLFSFIAQWRWVFRAHSAPKKTSERA